jgi:hypothetical protein
MIYVGLRYRQSEVLFLQRGKGFEQPLGERQRYALERLIEQQEFGADAKSRAGRDQSLLALAQQQLRLRSRRVRRAS